MGIDHRVDVDINGFVENLKNKIGINVDALFIENKIFEFVDNVVEEIRGKTSKVEKYFKILAIFTNPNYEFSENDLEELFKEDTIDFGSLFILMDHLKVKYAKFQIKHDPIYENGLDFNLHVLAGGVDVELFTGGKILRGGIADVLHLEGDHVLFHSHSTGQGIPLASDKCAERGSGDTQHYGHQNEIVYGIQFLPCFVRL